MFVDLSGVMFVSVVGINFIMDALMVVVVGRGGVEMVMVVLLVRWV